MKQKSLSRIFLVFLFTLCLYFPSQSQTHKYFIISGKIVTDSVNFKNCSIEISRKDKKVIVSPVSVQGSFRLELDYNSEYRLIFHGCRGYSKAVHVNTSIPQEWLEKTENLPRFLMAVRLLGDDSGLGTSVQEISFSPEQNCFSRVKTPLDYEMVERASSNKNGYIREQIIQSKASGYQIF